ncbi:hypothetical protein MTP99_012431 [Tenebrio molitor]|jgi:hypothetical protein|nr:hypothetical protein MTP99_012431 [Tenebrio molitor]
MADDTAFISNICKMVYVGGGEEGRHGCHALYLNRPSPCNSNNNLEDAAASFDNLTCVYTVTLNELLR